MAEQTTRLGKGLAALIDTESPAGEISRKYVEDFDVDRIVPNPYQPRMHIDPEKLIELADSIREHGVIQPLLITKDKDSDKYNIVAGERRFRAVQLAGFKTVPVVIKETSPREMLEIALIENIQREDL
ncbi:MAG: ParB/RepB/Spo0J family partition protein, partial [Candidatus Dojkabacteria bacterium]